MKLKVTRSDGAVLEAEGTPDELKAWGVGQAEPVKTVTEKGWAQPKPEVALINGWWYESKRYTLHQGSPENCEACKRQLSPPKTLQAQPQPSQCLACSGAPWFGILPPPCTCGGSLSKLSEWFTYVGTTSSVRSHPAQLFSSPTLPIPLKE